MLYSGVMKMNYRKDIYEKVKFMLKDNSEVNINCSKIARQYGCDHRTVSNAVNAVKNNLSPPKVNRPRKTDGFINKTRDYPKFCVKSIQDLQDDI